MLSEFRHHGQLLVTTSALQIKPFKSVEKIRGYTSDAGLQSHQWDQRDGRALAKLVHRSGDRVFRPTSSK
jgi:hypothetical protein